MFGAQRVIAELGVITNLLVWISGVLKKSS